MLSVSWIESCPVSDKMSRKWQNVPYVTHFSVLFDNISEKMQYFDKIFAGKLLYEKHLLKVNKEDSSLKGSWAFKKQLLIPK